MIDLVKQRIAITDGQLKAAFVISRAIPNTRLAKDVLDVLAEHDLPVLTGTTQKTAYASAAALGQSVMTFDPSGKAAQEMLALLKQVM